MLAACPWWLNPLITLSDYTCLIDQRHCHASPLHFSDHLYQQHLKSKGEKKTNWRVISFCSEMMSNQDISGRKERHFYGSKTKTNKQKHLRTKRKLVFMSHIAKGMRPLETSWVCQNNDNNSSFLHSSDMCSDSEEERGINSWVGKISFTSGVRGPVACIRFFPHMLIQHV